MDYTLAIASTMLIALNFAISKKYQSRAETSLRAGLFFSLATSFFTAIMFCAMGGWNQPFSLFSLIVSAAQSTCSILYTLLGFRILKSGGMSLYSMFLMSGGMLLPYIFGLLFWGENEELNVFRIVGILIILAAVVLSNYNPANKINVKLILLCVSVFVLNGCVSILSKYHQITTAYPTVDSTGYVMYGGIIGMLPCAAVLPFCKQETEVEKGSIWRFLLLLAAGSAVISGVGYLFQLIGAKTLPATVLYPIVTGGAVLFSTLAGKFFFKEKVSMAQWIGVGLCFVGTCLFL